MWFISTAKSLFVQELRQFPATSIYLYYCLLVGWRLSSYIFRDLYHSVSTLLHPNSFLTLNLTFVGHYRWERSSKRFFCLNSLLRHRPLLSPRSSFRNQLQLLSVMHTTTLTTSFPTLYLLRFLSPHLTTSVKTLSILLCPRYWNIVSTSLTGIDLESFK